jgi:transcriptional regulator with XRE-family HTH domain
MTNKTTTLNKGAEKLASFLVRMGWTPRKLARLLDCDHSSVIGWQQGRTIPTLHRALDLEREAGVDPHDWVVPVTVDIPGP